MSDYAALHADYRRRMAENEADPEFQRAKAERQARRDADNAWLREQGKDRPPLRGDEHGGASYGGYSAGRR